MASRQQAIVISDSEDDIEMDQEEDAAPFLLVRPPEPGVGHVNIMSRPHALEDACAYYSTKQLTLAEIKFGRESVAGRWLSQSPTRVRNFLKITEEDLTALFALYDEIFFSSAFRTYFTRTGSAFRITPSARLTRVAGRCAYDVAKKRYGCMYWMEISVKIMKNLFTTAHAHPIGGLLCYTRLECLQITLEHEMIHLLTYLWRTCDEGKAHGKIFRQLVFNIFGHTDFRHNLGVSLSQAQSGDYLPAKEKIKKIKSELHIGAVIRYKDIQYTVTEKHPVKFYAKDPQGRVLKVPYIFKGYEVLRNDPVFPKSVPKAPSIPKAAPYVPKQAPIVLPKPYVPKQAPIVIPKAPVMPPKQAPKAQNVFLIDYSEKAIAVYGDTKPIKDKLLSLGGKFNMNLTISGVKQPGWIFSKKYRAVVEDLIRPTPYEQDIMDEQEDGPETQWVSQEEWRDRREEWGLSPGELWDGYTAHLQAYPPPPGVRLPPRVRPDWSNGY